jgi:hypothetical protein
VSLGFVHACEQNHLNLSVIGGGRVVPLAAGKVVISPLDRLWVYNFAFGIRRAFDLDAAARAFRDGGRDYVHVLASPSSHAGLPDELARLGFRHAETQAYRRAAGTGAGAPGLLELGGDQAEAFLATWADAWGGGHATDGRAEAVRRRLADPRSRAYRSADGAGVFLLFDAGPTTQLAHLGVAAAAQGRGLGRWMLALAPGLVEAGRPLWLFTAAGEAGDRTAAAAGWSLHHRADDWLLDLPEPTEGDR